MPQGPQSYSLIASGPSGDPTEAGEGAGDLSTGGKVAIAAIGSLVGVALIAGVAVFVLPALGVSAFACCKSSDNQSAAYYQGGAPPQHSQQQAGYGQQSGYGQQRPAPGSAQQYSRGAPQGAPMQNKPAYMAQPYSGAQQGGGGRRAPPARPGQRAPPTRPARDW